MPVGKPVICTDSGGVKDIVNEETGIITEKKVRIYYQSNKFHNQKLP